MEKPRKTWDQIGVDLLTEVKEAIKLLNFDTMTPVQAAVIPLLLGKKDVGVQAVTGSGKTLAFLIPMLEMFLRREKQNPWKKTEVGGIIISPTRELASQTFDVLKQLLQNLKEISHVLLVGGNPVEDDVNLIKKKGANIIVCTPGRLEDLLTRKSDLNLSVAVKNLEFLVLDEADRLLDLGFKNTINTILAHLPKQRRTGLFSATQTNQVDDLIRAGLRNPVLIAVTEKKAESTPSLLENFVMIVNAEDKLYNILSFLEEQMVTKALLFLPTCATVDYWSSILPSILPEALKNFPIMAIHGKMKQKRKRIIEDFKKIEKGLLLCTDVMARGIDIPEVDWVLQWDPPPNASAFVHRVGRTARQGLPGSALILLLPTEETYIDFLERNQKVKLNLIDPFTDDEMSNELLGSIQNLLLKNRTLFIKSNKAFVSHVRAYSKHECSLLFRVKDLSLIEMGIGYGLLKLPRMPELKNVDTTLYPSPLNLNVNAIPYLDKELEDKRLQKLKIYQETGVWPGKKQAPKKQTEPWSRTKQLKNIKKIKKGKRKLNKEAKLAREAKLVEQKKKRKKTLEEDVAELAKDVSLLKKLKKKKITEEECDKQMGIF